MHVCFSFNWYIARSQHKNDDFGLIVSLELACVNYTMNTCNLQMLHDDTSEAFDMYVDILVCNVDII